MIDLERVARLPVMTQPGLRERKKAETRAMIAAVATRMFIADGFEQVSIAQVAAEAGVAKMTVTNYFARKEDLVFDLAEHIVDQPLAALADRAPGRSALAAVRDGYLAALSAGDPTVVYASPAFARLIEDSPTLLTREREIHAQRETALASALAAETAADPDDLTPCVAAATLAAPLRILNVDVRRRILAGQDLEAIRSGLHEAADAAYRMLEPSFGAYAVRE
jgi:AcrR family transcriptional regulator